MEWIMTTQNNQLLMLTWKLKVKILLSSKETEQNPYILQKDGKF